MNLGNKILELRKKHHMSQEQLAEVLNVTRQTISKWELDETSPDLKQAKIISETFNISLDELIDNNVKNLLVEKVSNTEKLAGLVIKILKIIGILFVVMLIIDAIAFIIFMTFRKEKTITGGMATLNCMINNEKYEITIGDDEYYQCDNCSKEMNVYLRDITNWANLETSTKNIQKYFKDNGGSCE